MIVYFLITFFCVASDAWGMNSKQLFAPSDQGSSRMHLGQGQKHSSISDLSGDADVDTSSVEEDDEDFGEENNLDSEKSENDQQKPRSVFSWLSSCIKSMFVGYTWVTNVLFNNHLRRAERVSNFRHAQFRGFVKDEHGKLDVSIQGLEKELVKINAGTIEKIMKVQGDLEKEIRSIRDAANQLDPETIFLKTRNKAEEHMRELQNNLKKIEVKISDKDITAKAFFSAQAKELLRQTEEHWAQAIFANVSEVNKKLSELEGKVSLKCGEIDRKSDAIVAIVLEAKEQVEQLKSASEANTSTLLSKIDFIDGEIAASAANDQKTRNALEIIQREKKTLEEINEELEKEKQDLMKKLEAEAKKNSALAQEAQKQHKEFSAVHGELLDILMKLMQEIADTRQALKNEKKEKEQEAKKNKELDLLSARVGLVLRNRSCSNKIISEGSIIPYQIDKNKIFSDQLFPDLDQLSPDLKRITL